MLVYIGDLDVTLAVALLIVLRNCCRLKPVDGRINNNTAWYCSYVYHTGIYTGWHDDAALHLPPSHYHQQNQRRRKIPPLQYYIKYNISDVQIAVNQRYAIDKRM